MPVLVLGPDRVSYISPYDRRKFLWGRLIPCLWWERAFEQAMYVDADTEFVASPNKLFDWLENWDFVLAETPERSLASKMVEEPEMAYSRQVLGSPDILYHNGGMFAWRRSKKVQEFFALWETEWLRFQSWDPQVALLRALARSKMTFLTLPYTWNCKEREETVLVYHQYGSHAAQASWHGARE